MTTHHMKIDINAWVATYNTTGKLPALRIPCATAGCEVTTTCFGSNLEGKISKHGSLHALLETFVCKACRASNKPAKVQVAKVVNKPAKVASKLQDKQVTEQAPAPLIDIHAAPVAYDLSNQAHVREITQEQCQRPDIYLNNDRSCDGCGLYEHCACTRKRLAA